MDKEPKDPKDPNLKDKLDKALDDEPGLARTVVREALKRGKEEEEEEERKTAEPELPMAENKPPEKPKREFGIKMYEQTVKLDNVMQAEQIRATLKEQEGDAIVHSDDGWIYVRRRAMVEEKDAENKSSSGDGDDSPSGAGNNGNPDSSRSRKGTKGTTGKEKDSNGRGGGSPPQGDIPA